MPNDTENYPEDSFDNMKTFAARHGLTFPCVIDTTQEVARAYGAQCSAYRRRQGCLRAHLGRRARRTEFA
jgi:peroxiredoxin